MPFPEQLLKTVGRWAVLIPLGLACLTVTRLHQMTGYNFGLTITMLQVVDQAPLLLSTLLGGAAFVALAVVAVTTALLTRRLLPGRSRRDGSTIHRPAPATRTALVSLGAGVAVLVFTLPALSLVVVAGVAASGFWFTAMTESTSHALRASPRAGARAVVAVTRFALAAFAVVFGAVLVYGALFAVPLRTSEQVVTSEDVYDDVWVMGEQGGQTLLLDDQQEARWVDSGSIVSRHLCAGEPAADRARTEPLPRLLDPPRRSTNLGDYVPCGS